jgi:multicomponent Na+:H+ antiporter subunit B
MTNKPEKRAGMNLITQTVTRWLIGPIVLYGIHIIFTGHFSPGGGFDSGVVIACAFVLITLAFGAKFARERMEKIMAAKIASLGALMFLAIALLGYTKGGFFRNFIPSANPALPLRIFSGGTVILSNIAICLIVGASLFMFFIILSVIRVVTDKDGKTKMIQRKQMEEE